MLGLLVGGGHDLHLVATLQLLAQRDDLVVDAGSDAAVAYLGVDMVGEVEHGGSLGELVEVALGGEHEDFVFIEVHLELVHSLHAVAHLEHGADVRQPVVESRLALHTLVAPVGSHTAFRNLVHALGAYLYLNPFLFGTQHGDVQALVAVRLGHTEPVAQSLGVRLVHRGDEGEGLPALHHLGAVQFSYLFPVSHISRLFPLSTHL